MALRDLPRVPAWQLLGALTFVLFVGSIATVLGAGRPPSSALELILTFVPPVVVGVVTLVLRARSRGRERRAAGDSVGQSEGGASAADASAEPKSDD